MGYFGDKLAILDIVILSIFLAFSFLIAIKSSKTNKGSKGIFLGGRSSSWLVLGISMVATTFAADTPLAVTEIVREKGIAGNWLWWNAIIGGMFTAIFFSIFWRRSDVTTEVELIELRYSGNAARLLRKIKAVHLGFLMNIMVMAWVNLAWTSILSYFFELNALQTKVALIAGILFIILYVYIGGLKGVIRTDAFQFLLAILGSIILAYFVVNSNEIGGLANLTNKIPKEALQFFPSIANDSAMFSLGLTTIIAYLGVIWWSSWYPGQEPGGGGYVVQRILSARSNKDAVLATILFQVGHFCLRPWPWIMVAICSVILYPDLSPSQARFGYLMVMNDFLPIGWKGLMLAGFTGAYMSTMSTQLNWGTSYLVNDLFAEEKVDKIGLKKLSLASMLILAFFSCVLTFYITSIKSVWQFILETGAGLGLVLILRWYWWRISVWSEITATFAPWLFYALSHFKLQLVFPNSLFFTVACTTITWLLITFLTPPESNTTLNKFYEKIKPLGWWTGIGKSPNNKILTYMLLAWAGGITFILSLLFLIGDILLNQASNLLILLPSSIVGALFLYIGLNKSKMLN